jgi:hypothetical protein
LSEQSRLVVGSAGYGRPADQIRATGDAGTLWRARKYAEAINGSLTRLGELLDKPEDVRELLLGKS